MYVGGVYTYRKFKKIKVPSMKPLPPSLIPVEATGTPALYKQTVRPPMTVSRGSTSTTKRLPAARFSNSFFVQNSREDGNQGGLHVGHFVPYY